MREKLLSLMKNENLTPSKLAELLGIQPSGISHILAGRNKPSFDLVQKILRRFPQINPDWLFLDQQPMYRTVADKGGASAPRSAADLFGEPTAATIPSDENRNPITANNSASTAEPDNGKADIPTSVVRSVAAARPQQKIRRIIILFDDHTFESFESPE